MNKQHNNNPAQIMNEEDNFSNKSQTSTQSGGGGEVFLDSPLPGKVLEETPIRVRDMINLYNFATEKNQELARAKSIYFGDSKLSSKTEIETEQEYCESICCNMPNMDEQTKQAVNGGRFNTGTGNFRISTSENQTSLRQSLEDANPAGSGESMEKSYQSKTTIRRTDQGVRIIIDIFFDNKDTDIEIVGSRVETDIPESRILADFQMHSLAMQQKASAPQVPVQVEVPASTQEEPNI